ncbi:MAG: DHA2 family efflux MFS transporter permease subunit [Novosphingobium sp.]
MTTEASLAQRVLATGGIMLATLTYTLDSTIANIALPHMQGSFSASIDQMVWVLTSYMVASAVMTPFSGWLAHRIGHKLLFQISTLLFMLASMAVGAAATLPQIVIFRVIQGIAGAALLPLSQALMLNMWPPRRLPVLMAIWSGVVTAAPIIGPTLGGWLTDTISWRWAFYINVPLDIAAVAIVHFTMARDEGGQQRPLDMIGFMGIVMFSVGTQLMMDRGEIKDWFDSTEVQIEATVAALGLYIFLIQMFASRNPFFPRELFKDRNFNFAQLMTLLLGSTLFATSALLPVLMQTLLGYTATQAGIVSMPRGYGSMFAFFLAPFFIARLGPKLTMLIGVAISTGALWQMGHFDLSMDETLLKTSGFLQGAGSGLAFNPMSVLTFATLEGSKRTEASVFSNMMRSIAGSIGISVYATIQLRQSTTLRGHLVSHLTPGDPNIAMQMPDLESVYSLARLNGEVNRQAAMIGYDTAFGYMCLASLLMIPIVLLMRTPKAVDPAEEVRDIPAH